MFARVEAPHTHSTMTGFWDLNLIHLFGFYLALMFVLSLYRRTSQYRAIGGLVLAGPGRWPHLLDLVRQHHSVFLTWSTFLPAILTLALTVIQMLASRLIWPRAYLTPASLTEEWLAWPLLAVTGLGMIGVDIYFLIVVGEIDRAMMEKYFDEAEYWLRSWTAPVVRFLSFGWINPRQMVSVEVQKALVAASRMMNTNLWWMSTQTGLRVAFGLSLWLTWALGDF